MSHSRPASASRLTRRASLVLPLLLFGCGGDERTSYPPLRYDYLPPLRLNVAKVDIEQRFYPAGVAPDISPRAPLQPVAALRQLGEDRVKAFGTTNRAVFAINDASLLRHGDEIDGALDVTVQIIADDGRNLGYAEARVARQHTGHIDGLRDTLYDMLSGMMNDMNVELEYQVKRNLHDWLTSDTAAPTPVSAAPLDAPVRR